MNPQPPADVEAYLAACTPEARARLQEIRQVILTAVPEAVESIAYQMPAYKLAGKPLVYYAAFKAHLGFYPTATGLDDLEAEMAPWKASKGTLQFPWNQPTPLDLVKKITLRRAEVIRQKK